VSESKPRVGTVGAEASFRRMVDPDLAAHYRAAGWWSDLALSDFVDANARQHPAGDAIICEGSRMTWRTYRDLSEELAGILMASDLAAGDRVAVLLPDGPAVHMTYLANEKAGLTTVGIGVRAGRRELLHLLGRTRATALLTFDEHEGRPSTELVEWLRREGVDLRRHIVIPRLVEAEGLGAATVDGERPQREPSGTVATLVEKRRLGPDDLFIINSTSGTTGLPKCVQHIQNRHFYINEMATVLGHLSGSDVVLSVVPAPFGFGLWTAHFTPAMLGAPTVLMERFSASEALRLIATERVTVLCCVSTQFIMMLNSPLAHDLDLTSLRVMFTGGEAIPYDKAREFEELTGAKVLQFYGSNESGVVTGTRLSDTPEQRLRTAGRLLPGTELRLFRDRVDISAEGHGQPGSRGPATCVGYLDDAEANAALFTDEGFLLHADECTVDEQGFLRVVGRITDLIIRGGKNISAATVEEAVLEHPGVILVAAVPVPDAVFGERVAVFVQLREGASLDLPTLTSFLVGQGFSKEALPEYLFVRDELPRSSGAKLAKGDLRKEAIRLADPSRFERGGAGSR
jgi:acyl-CoA synthetase